MVHEDMQKGDGHVFVLDPVEVFDVPRLALTTHKQKRVEHLKCSGELSVLSSLFSCGHSNSGRIAGDFVTWLFRL